MIIILEEGYSAHDSTWRRIAKRVGCTGERCSSGSGVDKSKFMKWLVKCPPRVIITYYRARKSRKRGFQLVVNVVTHIIMVIIVIIINLRGRKIKKEGSWTLVLKIYNFKYDI